MTAKRDFLSSVIDLYKELPCLWQTSHDDYHDHVERYLAWKQLVELFKTVEPHTTKDLVVKRINTMRGSFNKELNKIRKSKRLGSEARYIHVPRLWYYDKLTFLADQEVHKPLSSVHSQHNKLFRLQPLKFSLTAKPDFLFSVIDLYKELPCLWKKSHNNYHDKAEKNMAWEKLVELFKTVKPDATKDLVKKNINYMRCSFKKELNKVQESGAGLKNIYVPKLWYYDKLSFIADPDVPKPSRSVHSLLDEMPFGDDDDEIDKSLSNQDFEGARANKRSAPNEFEQEVSIEAAKQPEDSENVAFGGFIAAKHANLSDVQSVASEFKQEDFTEISIDAAKHPEDSAENVAFGGFIAAKHAKLSDVRSVPIEFKQEDFTDVSIDTAIQPEDSTENVAFEEFIAAKPSKPSNGRSVPSEFQQEVFTEASIVAVKQPDDLTESLAFGEFIAAKHAKLSDVQKMYAESLITNVLNKAVLNKLTEQTVVADIQSPFVWRS